MKSILLTSTALVAFAGVAAADGHTSISSALSATLGYNDTINQNDDGEIGFYWEGNLTTTATAALDNGLTAGASFEITVAEDDDDIDNDGGIELSSSDFVLSLEAENGGLFFGDTSPAAGQHWKSAGDMESDGVSTAADSAVIRGDVTVSTVTASVSYIVNDAFDDDGPDTNDALEQLAFGAAADIGESFFVTVAYQEETDFVDGSGDFNADEIFGISGGASFAALNGAEVILAYAENVTDDTTSTGIQVSLPFDGLGLTTTAYFVAEEGTDLPDEDPNFGIEVAYASGPISVTLDFENDQDSGGDGAGGTLIALDGSYDVGNGLELFAGYYTQDNEDGTDYADEFYVAGQFDLGGGASILVAYAEGEDNGDDEIGANDYQEGTTVELSFAF